MNECLLLMLISSLRIQKKLKKKYFKGFCQQNIGQKAVKQTLLRIISFFKKIKKKSKKVFLKPRFEQQDC